MEFVYRKKKKDATIYRIFLHIMYDSAERMELESMTSGVTGRHSNQLN